MDEIKNCCFCGKRLDLDENGNELMWKLDNNAQPIMEGRCCDECNRTKVIPLRIMRSGVDLKNLKKFW